MADLIGFKGNAKDTTIANALGPSDNVVTLSSTTIAADWPTGSDGYFEFDIDEGTSTHEKCKATSRSGVTISGVTRGHDGTVAVSHSAGAPIRHVFTANAARIANAHAATAAQGETDHSTLLNNARHDVTARHGFSVLGGVASTTASASAPGDTAAAGTASTYSRGDHKHGREAAGAGITYGSPGASAVGDSATDGTATTVARSDHKHGREAFGAPGSSAVGHAVANGSATTVARSDHQHGREAFGAVTAETTWAVASANGSATTIARSDHTHGTPALRMATTGVAAGSVTTTSTTYVALSGDPSTTIVIGPSGKLQVFVSASLNSDGNASALMAFEVTGGTVGAAASDDYALSVNGTNNMRASRMTNLGGFVAGETLTIRAMYRSNSGAQIASFAERRIDAISF